MLQFIHFMFYFNFLNFFFFLFFGLTTYMYFLYRFFGFFFRSHIWFESRIFVLFLFSCFCGVRAWCVFVGMSPIFHIFVCFFFLWSSTKTTLISYSVSVPSHCHGFIPTGYCIHLIVSQIGRGCLYLIRRRIQFPIL